MNQSRRTNLLTLLFPVLAILFIVVIQALQFHDRSYRQDEAWVVHYALENIARIGLLNHIMQVFRLLPPENVIQDIWVYLFGHAEHIVRFLSTLTTLLTLAMFYRLASDLFDKQTGRIAVFLLGTLSIFAFFTHEARPYAALAFGTVGFQWALLRFIRHPNRRYTLLTLFFGVIPFYQHPFLLYVYATQLICIVIFVRWNRDLYIRGIGLFAVLGTLVSFRIYINFAERSGEILYATPTTLKAFIFLYDEFKFNPEALGIFLFLSGLLIPITYLKSNMDDPVFRFGQRWRKWWMIVALVAMLTLVMFVNALSPNVTPRNLLVITPYIAVIVAYALRSIPWQGQLIVLFMLCIPFVGQFRYHISNAGYWELRDYMAEYYDPSQDRMMIIAPQSWEWIPMKYYLDERTDLGLSNTDILYVSTQRGGRFSPQPPDPSVMIEHGQPEDFQKIEDYVDEHETLWMIKGNPFTSQREDATLLDTHVIEWVEERYTPYNIAKFSDKGYHTAIEVIEYRRQPESLEPMVRFGDDITLTGWVLKDSVEIQACQTISIDTWWQTEQGSNTLYSSTLVIADENGQGVVNADDMPGGYAMTSLWQPDQLYFDERQLTIPCDIKAGQYNLLLGLYEIETIENLPVNSVDGEPMGTNLLYLTTLTVK
jgi:hypothetical protein